jgi:hypothetical protein
MKQNFSIFVTSFIQVFLVATNTIFLAKGYIIGLCLCSFLISYIWVLNVKKANIATKTHHFIYSLGAMIGALTGYYFTRIILN